MGECVCWERMITDALVDLLCLECRCLLGSHFYQTRGKPWATQEGACLPSPLDLIVRVDLSSDC